MFKYFLKSSLLQQGFMTSIKFTDVAFSDIVSSSNVPEDVREPDWGIHYAPLYVQLSSRASQSGWEDAQVIHLKDGKFLG